MLKSETFFALTCLLLEKKKPFSGGDLLNILGIRCHGKKGKIRCAGLTSDNNVLSLRAWDWKTMRNFLNNGNLRFKAFLISIVSKVEYA